MVARPEEEWWMHGRGAVAAVAGRWWLVEGRWPAAGRTRSRGERGRGVVRGCAAVAACQGTVEAQPRDGRGASSEGAVAAVTGPWSPAKGQWLAAILTTCSKWVWPRIGTRGLYGWLTDKSGARPK